jgi:pimeloyl-ACP methyl ester carboxylesterase
MHGAWCWERVVPQLEHESLAIDLPGRGSRGGSLNDLHVGDFVASAVADIRDAGWEDVVLVAHSLGGLTALGVAEALGSVRHVVFVSCVTPPAGAAPMDDLPQPFRWYMTRKMRNATSRPDGVMQIPGFIARRFFCSDLDSRDTRYVLDRCVPDAPWTLLDRVSQGGVPRGVGRTWVRLTKDRAIPPRIQDRMRSNVEPATVIELAAGHDAMISKPVELAAIINRAATAAFHRTPQA